MDVGPSIQAGRCPPSTPGLPSPRGLSNGQPDGLPASRPGIRVLPDPPRSA